MALFGQGGFIVQKFEGQKDPYIYNTGNSAFNLGYTHNSATKLELTCAVAPRNNYETIIGARNYSYQANAMVFFSKYDGFRPCYCRTGQEATGDYDSNTSSTSTMWYGQKVRIIMEGQSCLMENLETGAVHSITASSSTVNNGIAPLALFCQNRTSSSDGWDPFDFGYMVFFRLRIWENGGLLHDFVPAYSNSQYCIYDNIDGVYKYETYASGAYMLGKLNFIKEEADGGVEVLKDGFISNGSTRQYLTATFENVSVYRTLYLTFNYNSVDQYYIMPIEVSSIGSGLSTSVYLSPANDWLEFTITNTSITATYYRGSWTNIYVTIVAVRDVPATVCTKKITDNGTYVAINDGYAGYSSIEVDVAGGGGGGGGGGDVTKTILDHGQISDGANHQFITQSFDDISAFDIVYIVIDYDGTDNRVFGIKVSDIGNSLSFTADLPESHTNIDLTITKTSITGTWYPGSWCDVYATIYTICATGLETVLSDGVISDTTNYQTAYFSDISDYSKILVTMKWEGVPMTYSQVINVADIGNEMNITLNNVQITLTKTSIRSTYYSGDWHNITASIYAWCQLPANVERLFYFEGIQSDSVQIPPAISLDEDTNFSAYLSYDTTTKKFTVLKAFSAMVTGWVYQFQNASSYGTGQFIVNDSVKMNYQVPSTSAGSKNGNTGVFDFAVGDTFWAYQNTSNGWPQQFLKAYLIKNMGISGVIEWDDETA